MDSQLVKQDGIYSAFAVLRETLDCFLLSHEIMADPRLKQHPEVIFLYATLLAQYEYV